MLAQSRRRSAMVAPLSMHGHSGAMRKFEPAMTRCEAAPRPLVRRDFHARLATQMGMESPDNRPAMNAIVLG